MSEKVILCAVRTAGVLLTVIVAIIGAKYLDLDYDDVRVLLGLFNAYFPEVVALALGAAVGVSLYRATLADNDFNFIHFFVSKHGRHEDIFKFGYFILLICCVWVIFTMVWRDKLTEGILGIILGAFILKNIADVGGKIWGKKAEAKEEGKP